MCVQVWKHYFNSCISVLLWKGNLFGRGKKCSISLLEVETKVLRAKFGRLPFLLFLPSSVPFNLPHPSLLSFLLPFLKNIS